LSQKRTTAVRRKGGDRSPARRTGSGLVYGTLVANHRTRLGLTQRELAARVRISASTIGRIEQGHPPDAQTREKLAAIFNFHPPSPIRRVVTKIAPHGPMPRPHISLGSRWLWAGVAAVVLALLVLAMSAISGSGGTDSSLQPSVAVSHVVGPPGAIHHARVQAEKLAAAEARRAASERKREREAAAAAAAASAATKKKAAAKEARQNAAAAPEPVTPPVAPPPAPSNGGVGGGLGPAPDLQHGIGAQGG